MYHLQQSFPSSKLGKHVRKMISSGYTLFHKANLEQMRLKYITEWALLF